LQESILHLPASRPGSLTKFHCHKCIMLTEYNTRIIMIMENDDILSGYNLPLELLSISLQRLQSFLYCHVMNSFYLLRESLQQYSYRSTMKLAKNLILLKWKISIKVLETREWIGDYLLMKISRFMLQFYSSLSPTSVIQEAKHSKWPIFILRCWI
jgi:hypothetical protein